MRHVQVLVLVVSTVACSASEPVTRPTSVQTATMLGVVTESIPTTSTFITGATVTVVGGPQAGQGTVTDANGAFQLALSPGEVTLRVQAPNYVERSVPVSLPQNQAVAIRLDPVFQMTTTNRYETIVSDHSCPDWWSFYPPGRLGGPCKTDYLFNVHHAGTLTAEVIWADKMRSPHMAVYVSTGGQPSGSPLPSEPGFNSMAGRLSVELFAHTQYVLQVSVFDSGGGPAPAGTTSFELVLRRPN